MNISFLYSGGTQCSAHCVTPSKVLGKDIDIDAEITEAHNGNGRVVKEVPCDRLLLVDTCLGLDRLKTVSSDCSFYIPENKDELNDAKLVLKELMERKIFVLTEAKRPNIQGIKEECRKSFYTPEGTLINERFALRNLSPLQMSEAGLKFVGDSSNDKTQCYFDYDHALYYWEDNDDPVGEHVRIYEHLCIDDIKYQIPILSSANGEEIKGDAYHLVMPEGGEGCVGLYCNAATILSHTGAPIKQITSKELLADIDRAKIENVKADLEKKLTLQQIDGEYLDLLKQLLTLDHFSGLFREYDQALQDFVALLARYKPQLQDDKVADVESVLASLKLSPVKIEVESAVGKLANLKMVKASSELLGHLPEKIREAGKSAMESTALDDLSRFASRQSGVHFLDDFLNDLVSTGKLGYLCSGNYFKSDKRNENLMEIVEKGGDLTATLVNISERIHSLVKPYLPVERETSSFYVKDLIKRFESM